MILPLLAAFLIAGQQPPLVNLTTDKTIEQQLGCNSHQHAGNTPSGKIACVENAPDCIPVQAFIQKSGTLPAGPAPLKCGKYQHKQEWDECLQGYTCILGKPEHTIHHAQCVDVMYTVTEREWVELKDHVRALEKRLCVGSESGVLFDCNVRPPNPAVTLHNVHVYCPTGTHPSKEKGDIPIERICEPDPPKEQR